MDDQIAHFLENADWETLMPKLLRYADYLVCDAKWRGAHLNGGQNVSPSGDSFSAEDAVNQAIDRFLNGKRNYQDAVSLEQNLKGAIRSIISSWNKSSNRKPLIEISPTSDEEGNPGDPIQEAADPKTLGDSPTIRAERKSHQKALFDSFAASLDGDNELAALFRAYRDEIYRPQKIEAVTGIPAARVSELKRKLRLRMSKFIDSDPVAAVALEKIYHATRNI